jgi:hypothetical protein
LAIGSVLARARPRALVALEPRGGPNPLGGPNRTWSRRVEWGAAVDERTLGVDVAVAAAVVGAKSPNPPA